MFYILHGADSFSRHEAVTALRAGLDTDGMLATNTTVLEARRLELPDLTMVCDALPFLGSNRLVHVIGLLARAEGERAPSGRRSGRGSRATTAAADEPPAGWLALAEYVDRMPPSTTLLLEDGDIRSSNALLAALTPKAKVRKFEQITTRSLTSWIGERARRRGVLFDGAALRLLAESVPTDLAEDRQWHALWTLTAEIEKLSLYASAERISESDVRHLVPAALESQIYRLTDAVAERRGDDALRVLEELLASGRPAPVLLAAIAGRYRQLLLLRELLDARVPPGEIMDRLSLRNELQYRRLRDQAAHASPARLEAAYQRILHADRAVKQGRLDDGTALEVLVAELTI
jgi:DNA polymerase-3 subunit delta